MIHIIKDEQGNPIGWEMIPTTLEEQKTVATVRDLQFFGFDDTAIVYDGLTLIDPEKGKTTSNLLKLKWIQKKESFSFKLNNDSRNSKE
jgi:hypothetical protein